MWSIIWHVVGGLALTGFGAIFLFQRRDDVQATVIVRLSEEGLTFHYRISTPGFTYEGLEGIVLYANSSEIPLLDYVLVKLASTAAVLSGLLITADAIPAIAASTQPLTDLLPTVFRTGLLVLFALMAFRFTTKRRAIADALSCLRRDPFASLTDSAKEVLTESLQGEPLEGLKSAVAKMALSAVPPRAWALLVPMFLFAAVLWWTIQPWVQSSL